MICLEGRRLAVRPVRRGGSRSQAALPRPVPAGREGRCREPAGVQRPKRHRSGSGDSNPVYLAPGEVRSPLHDIPVRAWTTGDSNPAPPVCRTGALPAELAAHEPGPGRGRALAAGDRVMRSPRAALGVSHCGVLKVRADSPRRVPLRWAGRIRTPIHGVGDRCSAVELRPIKCAVVEKETARQGFILGAAPACA
jgi:hypothetical protein